VGQAEQRSSICAREAWFRSLRLPIHLLREDHGDRRRGQQRHTAAALHGALEPPGPKVASSSLRRHRLLCFLAGPPLGKQMQIAGAPDCGQFCARTQSRETFFASRENHEVADWVVNTACAN
jgi:hypothetical protein